MGPGPNGVGIVIRRHDLTRFREVAAFGDGGPPPGGGGGIPPAIPPAGGGGIQPPAGGGIGNPAGGGVVIPPASLPGGSSGMPTIPGGGTIPALPPPPTGGPQTPVPPPAGLPTIPKSGLSGSGEIGPQGGKINPGHLLTDAHPPSPAGGRISPAAYEPQSSGTTYPSTPSRVNTALAHTDPSSTGKRLSTPSPSTWPSSEPRSAPPENSHQTPPGTQPGPISTTSARLPQISPWHLSATTPWFRTTPPRTSEPNTHHRCGVIRHTLACTTTHHMLLPPSTPCSFCSISCVHSLYRNITVQPILREQRKI
jgi:hypothetical protein